MFCGMAGWLSCASAVLLSHTLGWDSSYIRQVIFGIFVAHHSQPDHSKALVYGIAWRCLKYALVGIITLMGFRHFLPVTSTTKWADPGKVLLFLCRTTHSRLFPKKHSFAYSYLAVGIPVGWEGVSGGMVSSSFRKPAWFSLSNPNASWYNVDPADHLEHGQAHMGLRHKLDAYLKSEGANPAAYPHAYLVTAARFLGYLFNPVSFWYLYSADLSLAAMIVEVNNTSGERRMYFLTQEAAVKDSQIDDADVLRNANSRLSNTPVFQKEWPKDLHASPFNSRKGSYRIAVSDPLKALSEDMDPIDCTITLKSSKGHAKLVARLISHGQPIDPLKMTAVQKIRFLLSWWWVGFVTFPRMVNEAGRLWFQRRLHFWHKPVPLEKSLGRNAVSAERTMEVAFRRYLRSLVEQCQAPIALTYVPSGTSDSAKESMLSPSAKAKQDDGIEEIEFKALTPEFYTRFAFYAHDLEALFSELRESCTIWVSRPDLLPKLLFRKPTAALEVRSPMDYLYFGAIRYLRRRPERIMRPLTSSQPPPRSSTHTVAVDIRDFRNSPMDAFMLRQEDAKMRKRYRSIVLKLFVAERFALGRLLLVEAVLIMLQTWLAWRIAFAWDGKTRILALAAAVQMFGDG